MIMHFNSCIPISIVHSLLVCADTAPHHPGEMQFCPLLQEGLQNFFAKVSGLVPMPSLSFLSGAVYGKLGEGLGIRSTQVKSLHSLIPGEKVMA